MRSETERRTAEEEEEEEEEESGSTHTGFYRDRYGIRRGFYIHPRDRRYRAWEIFILLWAVYSCFFTTVEFGFFRGLPHHLSLLDTVGQAAFYMDVFLQFFVAYTDSRTYKMVINRQFITIRYLKSYFVFELLACMPWDNIYKASGRKEGVRCLLLIRLVRARKVFDFMSKLDKDIRVNYMFSIICKLIAAKIYCTHVAACILYYLATTLPSEKEEYTWIGSLKLGDYSYSNFRDIGLLKRYTTALYFAVGYGNIQAVSLREIIFVMLYVSFDTVLVAYLIGNITALIVRGSKIERYKDRMTRVNNFLSRNGLKRKKIYGEVENRLRFEYERINTDPSDVIQDLPSSLGRKVSGILYKRHIENVSLFRGCSLEFIKYIASRVHEEYFFKGDVIMEQGIVVDKVCFVCYGTLEKVVIPEDGSIETLSILEHDSFGDVNILCNIPQSCTVQVRNICQLLWIDRQSFSTSLDLYPYDGSKIRKNLLERYEGDVRMKHLVTDITIPTGVTETELALRLNCSSYSGDLSQLKSLIQAGADPNKKDHDGRSPLHIAASKGHENITLFLIQQGVEVNSFDKFGSTPLLDAIKNGHDNIASLLVKQGASLKIDDAGNFLCSYVARGDIDFTKRILSYGIDPNLKDYSFQTPLHVATLQGSYLIAKLLVEAGADILSKDGWGNTPLDEARSSGNKILIKLLEEAQSIRSPEFPSTDI